LGDESWYKGIRFIPGPTILRRWKGSLSILWAQENKRLLLGGNGGTGQEGYCRVFVIQGVCLSLAGTGHPMDLDLLQLVHVVLFREN
jgi:hypothetical protein